MSTTDRLACTAYVRMSMTFVKDGFLNLYVALFSNTSQIAAVSTAVDSDLCCFSLLGSPLCSAKSVTFILPSGGHRILQVSSPLRGWSSAMTFSQCLKTLLSYILSNYVAVYCKRGSLVFLHGRKQRSERIYLCI